AGILGAALFYLLVWSPVESGLAKARSRLASVQAQLARVQEQAARVASVRAAPRVTLPANPAAAVGQAAERQGLREQLKRVDAEGVRSAILRAPSGRAGACSRCARAELFAASPTSSGAAIRCRC